nr:flippase [Natronocella acetinitrilica]
MLAQRLKGLRGEGLRGQLVKGGIGSLGVNGGRILLQFAVAVVLARALGAAGYGVYAFALAIVTLLAIPAQVGLPQLVVRETARAQVEERWARMRGLWTWSTVFVLAFSAVLLVPFVIAWTVGIPFLSEDRASALLWGLLLVPLLALGQLRGAALHGLRRVVLGQLPEHIIRPALLVIFTLIVIVLPLSYPLDAAGAMALHLLAAAIAFVFGAWLLLRHIPEQLHGLRTREYDARVWLSAAWPLALLGGMHVINHSAAVVVLGFFATDADVGVYRIVAQAATLVSFGLTALTQVVMPHFSRLHREGDYHRLQQLVTQSARAILLLSLPPAIVFVLFGEWILAVVFGEEFAVGYVALVILVSGQLVHAAMGPVAILLNMTGHEKDSLKGVATAAVLNVALNLSLVPLFGLEGAAVAMALTLTTWNLLLRRAVMRRLGLEMLAVPMTRKTRHD